MRYLLILTSVLLFSLSCFSQSNRSHNTRSPYVDSINAYVSTYVSTHEVVKGKDRKYLHFFPPDSNYRVLATFEKMDDPTGFKMLTSRQATQPYFRYGKINFVINGKSCQLTVYQSKALMQRAEYKNYLFIPFTDATSGTETYEGGRYIDITIPDIQNNKVIIDFNKAYNPYCCYASGYNCPVPPKENTLPIAIDAGEKKYTKPGH